MKIAVRIAQTSGALFIASSVAMADPCHAPLPAAGTTFAGIVTYVGDGDSLCVGHADGGIEVRLADFSAPELREAGGKAAKAALEIIALNQEAICVAGKRSYDRTVAFCTIDGAPIGELMRQRGIVEGGR